MVAAALVVAGCARPPARPAGLREATCQFAVFNRTPHALEIRLGLRRGSPAPIGAINPGESLTHAVACAEDRVWVGGVPIPSQVGAPVRFGLVQHSAELVEGSRVEISLHCPLTRPC